MQHLISAFILVAGLCELGGLAIAQTEPTLIISLGAGTQTYSATELLDREDAATIQVDDVAYKQSMTYRAVPLRALAGDLGATDFETVETRATDGFVAQVPLSLLADSSATPWIAIEDPKKPWPKLPGKDYSAGPFYLVWENTAASDVGSEQWIYSLAEIQGVLSPAERWPQMAVGVSLPKDAPERLGLQVFVKNCLPCHRLAGAGNGDQGPDLARPMPATAYLTHDGLRKLVRDPASVRSWPNMQMKGFDTDAISDDELTALIAYLEYVAAK